VLDINYYPLNEQREDALRKRKIGLGIMGLGSALAMLRVRYGSDESVGWVDKIMSFMRDTAYSYSVELGEEKGIFPLFDQEKYLEGEFIKALPENIREAIRTKGIRNSNLLTIAPTGSISQLAGNVSSGVEPIFCIEYERTNYGEVTPVKDSTFQLYCDMFGQAPVKNAPAYFVGAHDLTPEEHLKVMAACQKYIDASISKTINLPESITVKEMENVYLHAYELGCKGCTVYREGSLDEEILKKKEARKQSFNPKGYYDLDGKRYQVKFPDSKHAYYLNFSHVRNGEGDIRPFELFINTKDPQVDEWTRALGRLVSAVFRNVEDPTFLAEEFKEVYAQSGFFSSRRRKFVPSIVAEFGHVLADYFSYIGLMEQEVPIEAYAEVNGNDAKAKPHLGYCKKCGQQSLIYQEGCMKCINPACYFNRCG
jgi:ribonucleoside-diphosphate reductase alpha chain